MSDGESSGSVLSGFFWMMLVSLLLVWLPTIGPLIGGIVGGKKAGGVGKGILASLLPLVVFGGGAFFAASALTGLPIIGMLAGMGGFVFALLFIGPLFIGAIIGGALA